MFASAQLIVGARTLGIDMVIKKDKHGENVGLIFDITNKVVYTKLTCSKYGASIVKIEVNPDLTKDLKPIASQVILYLTMLYPLAKLSYQALALDADLLTYQEGKQALALHKFEKEVEQAKKDRKLIDFNKNKFKH